MTDPGYSALRPEHPLARSLAELIEHFGLVSRGDFASDSVTGITLSSKNVRSGDLYVGLPGRNAHGAAFAADAAAQGAVAILTDEDGARISSASGLAAIVTENPRAVLAEVAAWIYRTRENPPTMFGVTGTNGKTSVTYILDAILGQLGVKVGFSTTAERAIGSLRITSTLTTPEATEVHGLLARMREADVGAVIIEVSAQALTRHRVDGIVFDVVGFTNLTHDHLDDYGDMQTYFEAKRDLFTPGRARRGVAIVDSEWGRKIATLATIPVSTIATRAGVEADWQVTLTEESAERTAFIISAPGGEHLSTSVPILGRYMAENAALAIVMLVEAGFTLAEIDRVLTRDGGILAYIPGRAELVSGARGPRVYIDYGHSPDAFTTTLESLRRTATGRIIMVFGADGDRDTSKREEMASIAATLSDVVVVTDYNPRFENPAEIRRVLLDSARRTRPELELYEVPNPWDAFRQALAVAGEGDVILHAGPGHENYHDVAGEKISYSARDDARSALTEHGWL